MQYLTPCIFICWPLTPGCSHGSQYLSSNTSYHIFHAGRLSCSLLKFPCLPQCQKYNTHLKEIWQIYNGIFWVYHEYLLDIPQGTFVHKIEVLMKYAL